MTKNHQAIINRLKRIEGQSAALRTALEAETTCEKIIPQFLAVKGGFDASLQEYLKMSLNECVNKKSASEIEQILNLVIKKLK